MAIDAVHVDGQLTIFGPIARPMDPAAPPGTTDSNTCIRRRKGGDGSCSCRDCTNHAEYLRLLRAGLLEPPKGRS